MQTLRASGYRYFVLVNAEQITGYGHFMLVNTERITGYRHLCIGGCQTDHRTDCWIQGTNLSVKYMDSTVVWSDWFHYFIIVLLYKLLRVSQLTVIILLIVK